MSVCLAVKTPSGCYLAADTATTDANDLRGPSAGKIAVGPKGLIAISVSGQYRGVVVIRENMEAIEAAFVSGGIKDVAKTIKQCFISEGHDPVKEQGAAPYFYDHLLAVTEQDVYCLGCNFGYMAGEMLQPFVSGSGGRIALGAWTAARRISEGRDHEDVIIHYAVSTAIHHVSSTGGPVESWRPGSTTTQRTAAYSMAQELNPQPRP